MEDFGELARRRRSVRRYGGGDAARDDVLRVVRSALMAPSGKGLRSCRFVVVDDAESLRSLARCKDAGCEFLGGAAFAVVVIGCPDVSDTWTEDGSAAGMMMLMQAEDLGLGGCWVQVRGRRDADGNSAEGNVRRVLGVPDGMRVLCVMSFGRKERERRPHGEESLRWDCVSLNRYGAGLMEAWTDGQ